VSDVHVQWNRQILFVEILPCLAGLQLPTCTAWGGFTPPQR